VIGAAQIDDHSQVSRLPGRAVVNETEVAVDLDRFLVLWMDAEREQPPFFRVRKGLPHQVLEDSPSVAIGLVPRWLALERRLHPVKRDDVDGSPRTLLGVVPAPLRSAKRSVADQLSSYGLVQPYACAVIGHVVQG